jgi:hypothetical protein
MKLHRPRRRTQCNMVTGRSSDPGIAKQQRAAHHRYMEGRLVRRRGVCDGAKTA